MSLSKLQAAYQDSPDIPQSNIIKHVFKLLCQSDNLSPAINDALELIASYFHYQRAYIFERLDGEDRLSCSYQWNNPSSTTTLPPLPVIPIAKWENDYKLTFNQNTTGTFSQEAGVRGAPISTIQYALYDHLGACVGFLGLDNPSGLHDQQALLQIQTIKQVIDLFLAEKRSFNALQDYKFLLQHTIDCIDHISYVVNPVSKILLLVNSYTSEKLPMAVSGAHCYMAIRGRQTPCPDCPFPNMVKNNQPLNNSVVSKIFMDSLQAELLVDFSLIKPLHKDNEFYGIVNASSIVSQPKTTTGQLTLSEDTSFFTRDALLYDSLCKSTDDYIYMCYMPKNLFYFPQPMVEEFALPGNLVENGLELWATRIHERDRPAFLEDFEYLLAGKSNIHNQDYRVKNIDGNFVWVRCRGYLAHDENGNPTLFTGFITHLEKKSKIDHLSGLMDKYELENQLRNFLANDFGNGAFMLLGLDNFKHINNLYGWEFGDSVIRMTSQKIQNVLTDARHLYRMDGDTFGVFVPNGSEINILEIYSDIRRIFQNRQELQGHKYYNTVSGGYTVFQNSDISCETVFKQAEYALDFAKSEGKNRISKYSEESMSGLDRSIHLIELLREAMEKNFQGFSLNFQAQVETVSQHTVSAEALLRWHCVEYGQVAPIEFISILESTGLIHAAGHWVILKAAEVCSKWHKFKPDFSISVNVSYIQLLDKDFIPFLQNALSQYNLPPSAIHVELTETCIASSSASLKERFAKIRDLGIHLEMDDFGTGYSSLEILKTIPVDMVKIDRAFVKDITHSSFDATFIKFVTELCHSVGMKVCLEGVETWEEYDIVKEMDLDIIQGYLFGRPLNQEDFMNRYLIK